jgi:hypothetical protein
MMSRTKLAAFIGALALIACAVNAAPQQLQQITISYPTRTGQVWPLYIAKEGGYY